MKELKQNQQNSCNERKIIQSPFAANYYYHNLMFNNQSNNPYGIAPPPPLFPFYSPFYVRDPLINFSPIDTLTSTKTGNGNFFGDKPSMLMENNQEKINYVEIEKKINFEEKKIKQCPTVVKIEEEDSFARVERILQSNNEPQKHLEFSFKGLKQLDLLKQMINSFASKDIRNKSEKIQIVEEVSLIKKKLISLSPQTKQQKEIFLNQLIQIFFKKFMTYKKTKQELIKYIFRRIYHNLKFNRQRQKIPQFDRLEKFHNKNLEIHRSMNSKFLKRQFNNPLFDDLFRQFIEQMDKQFDEENQNRIEKLAEYTLSYYQKSQLRGFCFDKKMPWNVFYKGKAKKLAIDLLKIYSIERKKEKDEIQNKEIESINDS